MLNHSGKAPAVLLLRISALSYGVPQLAKMVQAVSAFLSSPLALVSLQANLWHVPEMLPENSQEERTQEQQGSIHLLANAVEKTMDHAWSLQSGICLQQTTKGSCLVGSQILAVYFKSISCTNSALGEIPAPQQLSCCSQRAENTWFSAKPPSLDFLASHVCTQSRNPHGSFLMGWKCWVPAAGTEQNYLCLKNKLWFFLNQNTAASTIPTTMRFSEFCPKERARGRRDADGNNQSPHSMSYKNLPWDSKSKGKARLHTDEKRCGQIYWCVYIKNKSLLFMLFVQLHYQKRGFKYKLVGLLKRWIYECIPNKTHSWRL